MTEPSYVTAARLAYDTVAVDYAKLLRDELAAKPVDRAQLGTFAELVLADGAGPVADIGCGPGRVAAHLHSLGLEVFGIDLSPGMIAVARETYPALRFDEGSMIALDLADGQLGGVVAWYSIIHTPPERLPVIFAEFHRVLRPGGYLQLAFQAGDEVVHLEQAYGHSLSLDAYRLSPDRIADLATQAGFALHTRVLRERIPPEKTRQAYLLVRKPGGSI
ncbi:class I SAM-dependent methyltransferase [Actinopolymorpha alba]|uniref:class I SAM-dependent methyltransferase n=1 Tax=Actinopolymorpha alba TaxID=533267 RepID=UPI0003695D7A|nr:class I SAM-dependent methyltransferase [Actinopolymorpha alba]